MVVKFLNSKETCMPIFIGRETVTAINPVVLGKRAHNGEIPIQKWLTLGRSPDIRLRAFVLDRVWELMPRLWRAAANAPC